MFSMTRTTLTLVMMTSLLHYVTAGPIDSHATPQTKNLFSVMRTIARDSQKIMVGKQDPTFFGAWGGHQPYAVYAGDGWMYKAYNARAHVPDDLCDPCAVVHDFPAVAGFDLMRMGTNDEDADAIPYLVDRAHERGAIVTMSWHVNNMVTGGNYRDDSFHVIKKILPGGENHHAFLSKLDEVADFAKKRVDKNGHLAPIIFRPWHELNGGWFWWGVGNDAHNTPDDIKNLYRETVKYLRDHKGVHNFLYAWSPDCTGSDTDVYPGDDYVDVIGLDCYLDPTNTPQRMVQKLDKFIQQAEAANKIPALTEVGVRDDKLRQHTHWYTQDILHTLTSSPRGMRIAYLLTWANLCHGNQQNGFVCDDRDPWPGHPTAGDYVKFYNDTRTVFLSDLKSDYPLLSH